LPIIIQQVEEYFQIEIIYGISKATRPGKKQSFRLNKKHQPQVKESFCRKKKKFK